MSHLPIAQLIGYDYNSAHWNHIHVSGSPMQRGEPPLSNPGMTPAIKQIYQALNAAFGPGAYFMSVPHHWEPDRFVIDDPKIKWTHMGGYNRRKIAGSTSWSQHAWWNGLDIGPYYGEEQQRPFRQFLERDVLPYIEEELTMAVLSDREQRELQKLIASWESVGSAPQFPEYVIPAFRELPGKIRGLENRLAALEAGGTVPSATIDEIKAELTRIKMGLRAAGGG